MVEKEIVIGRIGYSISCEEQVRLDECLESFLKPPSAEIAVHCRLTILRSEETPEVGKRRLDGRVFEAGAAWGLYQADQPEIILTVPSLKSRRRVRLLAQLDTCFGHGVVRVHQGGECYFLYPFLEVLTIGLLARTDGALLHACCLDDNGCGYLFVGESGAGKSTMARLWKSKRGVRILSDDRVAIAISETGLVAYGTPWPGDMKAALNSSVPVEKIFFIRHAKRNQAVPIGGINAASELLKTSFLPFWDREGMHRSLDCLTRLASRSSLFDLGFVPNETIVDFLRSA